MSHAKQPLHRQQLFHWIGRNVEERCRKGEINRETAADEYLKMLRGSVANGLWVKPPETSERLQLGHKTHSLRLPMTCFTEWNLGDSLPHTSNYGRMGFGFPRRWVLERGGQPVTYFRAAKASPFLGAIAAVLRAFEQTSGNHPALDSLDYLLHFAKPVNQFAEAKSPASKGRSPKRPKHPLPHNVFARKLSGPMRFVAEREWRIVEHRSKRFTRNPAGDRPPLFLEYKPGVDLFTLVLPDNYTVHRVMQDKELAKELLPVAAPHVTIISWEDVGTF